MKENYKLLVPRVLDTLDKSDLESIKKVLSEIKGNTICSGVGGSKVVSDYASLILEAKNNAATISIEPQTIKHRNLSLYDSVLTCSYSGKNQGVRMAFANDLQKYLLSTNSYDGVNNITYVSSYPKEHSFISLAATLMPMAILLSYYLDNDYNIIKEILGDTISFEVKSSNIYEILASSNPGPAETFLESTLTESGIAIPLVHGKYGYCHGRTTISYCNNSSIIHFNEFTELDELLTKEFEKYYDQIITLDSKYQDPIINKFYLTFVSMYLAAAIAESQGKDLSNVDHSPLVKKLYHYEGKM